MDTLELLKNKNSYYRCSVAQNPNTPQPLKDYLIAQLFMENYEFK